MRWSRCTFPAWVPFLMAPSALELFQQASTSQCDREVKSPPSPCEHAKSACIRRAIDASKLGVNEPEIRPRRSRRLLELGRSVFSKSSASSQTGGRDSGSLKEIG